MRPPRMPPDCIAHIEARTRAGARPDVIHTELRREFLFVCSVRTVTNYISDLRAKGVLPPSDAPGVRAPRVVSEAAGGKGADAQRAEIRPDPMSIAQRMDRDALRHVGVIDLCWEDAMTWGARNGADVTGGTNAEKLARVNAQRAAHFLPRIRVIAPRGPITPLPPPNFPSIANSELGW